MPELGHRALILVGGAALNFWFFVKVNNSEWGHGGMLAVAWTILALGYFGIGLSVKERWYQLTGLGTLAIALLSVTIGFFGKEAYLGSLLAIGVLFVGQQFARRRKNVLAPSYEVPDWAHKWLILVGGTLLFIWLSIKVSEPPGGPGLLTITWTILALGYFGLGLGLKERWYQLMGLGTLSLGLFSVIIEFIGGKAYWESLLAIAVLFVGQQLARRRGNEVKVPDGVHKWLILVGGTLLFTWLSIKVSDLDDLGLSTLTWTILALGYFGFGLGLKERWYRLMGLGTLAIALFSVTIEFIGKEAYWKSLVTIGVLIVGQQLARRQKNELKVFDWVHQGLILLGGAMFFIWLSIKVSDMGGHGLRTIAWTILGVCYFGLGLGWKERWYRLMGLGTLAIALLSLVPIIWQMDTDMKIASFFVMGLVFIGVGFVYTRFKDKIKKLL
jgi:type VI protein secretion system component VasF